MKPFLLKVPEEDLARWNTEAKKVGLTVAAWIRMKCSEETVLFVEPENPAAIALETKLRAANGTELKHTAASNRLTCQCPSCRDYRTRNDIPFGGEKK